MCINTYIVRNLRAFHFAWCGKELRMPAEVRSKHAIVGGEPLNLETRWNMKQPRAKRIPRVFFCWMMFFFSGLCSEIMQILIFSECKHIYIYIWFSYFYGFLCKYIIYIYILFFFWGGGGAGVSLCCYSSIFIYIVVFLLYMHASSQTSKLYCIYIYFFFFMESQLVP